MVQDGIVCAILIHFENRASLITAAAAGRAVKHSVITFHQRASRPISIRGAAKGVYYRIAAAVLVQPEHCAKPLGDKPPNAARESRPIERSVTAFHEFTDG